MHDVIIIGGSYAGISAAMPLALARRDVLVIDAGQRRNRFASLSHGFLGHDGVDPGIIAARGRSDLLGYATVTWREEEVTSARRDDDAFVVTTRSGETHGRRLILATGVVDELPPLPGLQERWGRTVLHCPYCHGYELAGGRLGVLATLAHSVVQAALVSDWSPRGNTTFFLGDAIAPTPEQLADVERRGIRLERAAVVAIEGGDHDVVVRLADGRAVALDGLFAVPHLGLAGPFAAELGCEIETHATGSAYRTDPATKETSVPGVFACGDAALPTSAVAFAVADGYRAGMGAHRSLVFAG